MKRPAKIAAIAVVAAIVGVFGDSWVDRSQPLPFDQAVWGNGDADKSMDPPRLRMADGLIKDQVLLGKTRTEIEALLGAPPKTDYFRGYDLVYWLGPERGFIRIDSEWLVIRLVAGEATEVRIVRD